MLRKRKKKKNTDILIQHEEEGEEEGAEKKKKRLLTNEFLGKLNDKKKRQLLHKNINTAPLHTDGRPDFLRQQPSLLSYTSKHQQSEEEEEEVPLFPKRKRLRQTAKEEIKNKSSEDQQGGDSFDCDKRKYHSDGPISDTQLGEWNKENVDNGQVTPISFSEVPIDDMEDMEEEVDWEGWL